MLVVPGRPSRRVDRPLAGPQEGGLRLALAGSAFPWGQARADRGQEPV